MEDKIKNVLNEVRPLLVQHLGDIEFVNFKDGVVYVRMLGACTHCPLSQMTLKAGVEEILKSRMSEVNKVEAVA